MIRAPIAVRFHARLVRSLVPSLGSDYAGQATVAFADHYRDARHVRGRRMALWSRELRSLAATVWRELWRTPPCSAPAAW